MMIKIFHDRTYCCHRTWIFINLLDNEDIIELKNRDQSSKFPIFVKD